MSLVILLVDPATYADVHALILAIDARLGTTVYSGDMIRADGGINMSGVVLMPQPATSAPAQPTLAASLLTSLCAWLLHAHGPQSPEGQEATLRMEAMRGQHWTDQRIIDETPWASPSGQGQILRWARQAGLLTEPARPEPSTES